MLKLIIFFKKSQPTLNLLYELRLEEADIINNYKKSMAGLLGSNNRRTLKMENFLNSIQNKIEEINNFPKNNNNDRRKIELAWYDFIISLGRGLYSNTR